MSLETAIQNLADAINALAATYVPTIIERTEPSAAPVVALPTEAPKRGRGRPPKAAPVAASAEFPSEEPEAPAAPLAPAPTPPPAADAGELTMVEVRKALIEVVKEKGKEACGALCRAHGGPNLSAIDPKQYPALHAAAIALLATGEG
jgi:hypothetical protein